MQFKGFVKNKTDSTAQGAIEKPFFVDTKKPLGKESIAQGAIEYLLIIGAAIIVVAILVIMLSGILSTTPKDNEENIDVAFDELKNVTYSKIGYAMNVEPGSEEDFFLDIEPNEKKLNIVFGESPAVEIIKVNGVTKFENNEWADSTYELKAGDTVKVKVASTQPPLKISVKGTYVPTALGALSLIKFEYGGTWRDLEEQLLDKTFVLILKNNLNESINITGIDFNGVLVNPVEGDAHGMRLLKPLNTDTPQGSVADDFDLGPISANHYFGIYYDGHNGARFTILTNPGQQITIPSVKIKYTVGSSSEVFNYEFKNIKTTIQNTVKLYNYYE